MLIKLLATSVALLVVLSHSEVYAMDCRAYWNAVAAREPARVEAAAAESGPLLDGEPCLVTFQNAVRAGSWPLAQAFLRTGTKVNVRSVDGSTPLMWAASAGQLQIMRGLLGAGASLEETDKAGQTPLFYAASAQDVASVQLLLAEGANVMHQDTSGRTAADAARFRRLEGTWLGFGLSVRLRTIIRTEARRVLQSAMRTA
jgi:hypothetical protein